MSSWKKGKELRISSDVDKIRRVFAMFLRKPFEDIWNDEEY